MTKKNNYNYFGHKLLQKDLGKLILSTRNKPPQERFEYLIRNIGVYNKSLKEEYKKCENNLTSLGFGIENGIEDFIRIKMQKLDILGYEYIGFLLPRSQVSLESERIEKLILRQLRPDFTLKELQEVHKRTNTHRIVGIMQRIKEKMQGYKRHSLLRRIGNWIVKNPTNPIIPKNMYDPVHKRISSYLDGFESETDELLASELIECQEGSRNLEFRLRVALEILGELPCYAVDRWARKFAYMLEDRTQLSYPINETSKEDKIRMHIENYVYVWEYNDIRIGHQQDMLFREYAYLYIRPLAERINFET